jgi:hypothetical protein
MYGRRDVERQRVGDMFHSHQVKPGRGLEVFDRCPDMLRTSPDKTRGQRGDAERHLDVQRAGQDRVLASHDMFARCPDQNDRCLGKQRAVRRKTQTVRGKQRAVAIVAQRYPDQQRAGHDRAPASHAIYDRCPDNNDKRPGKQRAVRRKTRTVRGKPPAATPGAQKYRDKTTGHVDDAEAIRPVTDNGVDLFREQTA